MKRLFYIMLILFLLLCSCKGKIKNPTREQLKNYVSAYADTLDETRDIGYSDDSFVEVMKIHLLEVFEVEDAFLEEIIKQYIRVEYAQAETRLAFTPFKAAMNEYKENEGKGKYTSNLKKLQKYFIYGEIFEDLFISPDILGGKSFTMIKILECSDTSFLAHGFHDNYITGYYMDHTGVGYNLNQIKKSSHWKHIFEDL